ncbi:HK97 family phage prohead protease [Qipengyuania gelatinilytica]|uniref:HK97 family phage prohead protease n=1 Tax=Qipengyuania gelatinilytica TaxID=2867231 RepID=A0ABX9A3B7_9SPHN|nr:HK97 family phage prohead protease [Qipengyuania gelatinilytica]QZD94327.1 HK97 family phage prohead protease [Qipengyuania gelatinilytica]
MSALRIAGYAALFDKPDGARDIIRPGAFHRTLAERREPFPLYWQHRPDQRIGWIETAGEDARGLRIIASIDNPQGRAAKLLRERAVNGLSFGYRARGFRKTANGRELADIELFEVSLVTHPLQDSARVHFLSDPQTPGATRPGRLASA